jgi:hypothetical protein
LDPKFSFPYKQANCIITNKYINKDGNQSQDDTMSIYNKYASVPSNFMVTYFETCKNNTAKGKVCATPEHIDKYITGMRIGIYMINHYVDLNNLD